MVLKSTISRHKPANLFQIINEPEIELRQKVESYFRNRKNVTKSHFRLLHVK